MKTFGNVFPKVPQRLSTQRTELYIWNLSWLLHSAPNFIWHFSALFYWTRSLCDKGHTKFIWMSINTHEQLWWQSEPFGTAHFRNVSRLATPFQLVKGWNELTVSRLQGCQKKGVVTYCQPLVIQKFLGCDSVSRIDFHKLFQNVFCCK